MCYFLSCSWLYPVISMTLFFRMYQMLIFILYFFCFFYFRNFYIDFYNFCFNFSISKQNGPAHSTSLSFKISSKCPIIFCNPRVENGSKVWYILKNSVYAVGLKIDHGPAKEIDQRSEALDLHNIISHINGSAHLTDIQ